SSICLSRTGSSGRVSGAGIMAPDYTGSGNETRRQDAVRAVAPQVNAVEQPVQFIDRQLDGRVPGIGLGLETLGLQTLEPQAETIAFPVEDFHLLRARLRNTNSTGLNTSTFISSATRATRPLMDL